jgi:Tol biopolymer transport system component
MTLPVGARVGPYEIRGQLGAGGMGEVYRARDTTLNRDVALKVLLPEVANDPERLARFKREAQVLASLNHPHIGAIHGFEESDGTSALVMELVEGEDLSQRIARGAVPIGEALPIARQIAEALEAAHEQGIIHRDLKPANIKVRADGTVKVLDFGLAKTNDPAGASSANAMNSPTLSIHATQAGIILGTAAYMSPEQAAGKPVDTRSDLWAFGVVLLEMLTGRQAFGGESISQVLAAVLKDEPDLAALPPHTPPEIRTLLRRCLQKDRKRRLADAGDARLEIEEALAGPAPETATAAAPAAAAVTSRFARYGPIALLSAISVGLLWPAWQHLRETLPAPGPELRLDIATPPSASPSAFALSPDGRSIVFVATDNGRSRLWLRALDQSQAKPIPDTDDAGWPFWSPDSRALGFFANATLHTLSLDGGPRRTLADAPSPGGGAWTRDGGILFTPGNGSGLLRVPASGGPVVPVTKLAEGEVGHLAPAVSSDGRHVLFAVSGRPEAQGIYLAALDADWRVRITEARRSAAGFLPPDRVAWIERDSLLVQRIDLEARHLVGHAVTVAPITVAIGVGLDAGSGFSVSMNGLLAYRSEPMRKRATMWRDRSGIQTGQVGEASRNSLQFPNLSSNGRSLVGARQLPQTDIWIVDLARNQESRFTFGGEGNTIPVWSPDGQQIAFVSLRTGTYGIYVGRMQQPGREELRFQTPYSTVVQDWSPDGKHLLYYETHPTSRNVFVLDMTAKDAPPKPIAATPATESIAQFSPDGRWVAYQTNASGRFEIVVKPFRDGSVEGGTWQVSKDGGVQPRWRKDGRELYFIAPDGALMATTIGAGVQSLEFSTPVKLFVTRISGGGGIGANALEYAVASDGRFLINEVVEEHVAPITVVINPRF